MDSSVSHKNHITRGPDCGMCSEKQACIARCQPSELLENLFVQAVLSLLGHTKLIICFSSTVWVIFVYYTNIYIYNELLVNIIQLTNLIVCVIV